MSKQNLDPAPTEENGQPLISVVIPTYNRANSLMKAIQSITAQTHKNLEIIVVNDGSKDDTTPRLQKFQKSEPRLRIIEQENQGVSTARNKGIHESRGDYIALLDDDDLAAPNRLESQLKELEKAPKGNATLCTTNAYWVAADGTQKLQEYPESIRPQELAENNLFIPPTSWFASKHTFKQVGDFDVTMKVGEDHDWLFRLARQNGNFVHTKEPLVTYSYTPGKIYTGHIEGIERLLEKHGDWLSAGASAHLRKEIDRAQQLNLQRSDAIDVPHSLNPSPKLVSGKGSTRQQLSPAAINVEMVETPKTKTQATGKKPSQQPSSSTFDA